MFLCLQVELRYSAASQRALVLGQLTFISGKVSSETALLSQKALSACLQSRSCAKVPVGTRLGFVSLC